MYCSPHAYPRWRQYVGSRRGFLAARLVGNPGMDPSTSPIEFPIIRSFLPFQIAYVANLGSRVQSLGA